MACTSSDSYFVVGNIGFVDSFADGFGMIEVDFDFDYFGIDIGCSVGSAADNFDGSHAVGSDDTVGYVDFDDTADFVVDVGCFADIDGFAAVH